MAKRRTFHLLKVILVFSLMIGAGVSCSSSNAPTELNFRITVRNGEPLDGVQILEVKQGDTVYIRYGTNSAASFRIQGYDIETEVEAGRQRIETFVADIIGRFEIKLVGSKETVAFLEVRSR